MSTRTWEGLTIPAAGTFTLDVAHTRIGFVVKHMMVSKVRGDFADFSGSVTVAENPLESSAELTIKTESINTGSPTVTATCAATTSCPSRSSRRSPSGAPASPATRATSSSSSATSPSATSPRRSSSPSSTAAPAPTRGARRVWGFSITTEIDREEFGLTWNQALETGGVLVGKKIKIEIEGEANRA